MYAKKWKKKVGGKVRKPLMLIAGACLAVAIAWPIIAIMAVIAAPFMILIAVAIFCYAVARLFSNSPDEGEENHG